MNSIFMVSGRCGVGQNKKTDQSLKEGHILFIGVSMCPALFLTPLVTIPRLGGAGGPPASSRQPGSSSTLAGGHDNLWLPANLIITALLAQRLLRLLPAHRFPQESALVFQLSFTPAHPGPELGVLKWCLLGDPKPLFPSTVLPSDFLIPEEELFKKHLETILHFLPLPVHLHVSTVPPAGPCQDFRRCHHCFP